MTKKSLLSMCLLLTACWSGYAQEINFSTYADYNLTVGELNNSELEFGQLVTGSGTYQVDINNGKIITIEGVEYLDIIVEVTAESDLYLNGNQGNAGDDQKSIPFTLEAAYANAKGLPTVGQAKVITGISGNSFIKRFPILERQHRPPGPPPTPPTNATDFEQLKETAYLYLYGSITVGEIDAGYYSGQVTVTINYE